MACFGQQATGGDGTDKPSVADEDQAGHTVLRAQYITWGEENM